MKLLPSLPLSSIATSLKKKPDENIKQVLPFKEVGDIFQLKDNNKWRLNLKVFPVNGDLLDKEELKDVAEAIQDALNGISCRIQITVSSERISIDDYLAYLDQKISETNYEFFLDRLVNLKNFTIKEADKSRSVHHFYITIESDSKDGHHAYDDLTDIYKVVSDCLAEQDLLTEKLDRNSNLRLFYEKLNPSLCFTQPFDNSMDMFSIAPGPIDNKDFYMIIDGRYYAFYIVSEYPRKVKKPGWMKKLLQMRGNVDVSFHLVPGDKNKVQKMISNAIQEFGVKLLGSLPPDIKKEYENKRKDAEELLDQILSDNQSMFYLTTIVCVHEDTLDNLKATKRRVELNIRSCRMRSRELIQEGLDPFFLTLPILYDSKLLSHNGWPMHSKAVGSIMPFDSSHLQQNTGVLRGFNAGNDSLIIVDYFDKKTWLNPHEFKMGMSGSGKSYDIKTETLRLLSQGIKCCLVDVERDLFFNFGNRIVFSVGSEFCTNPFHIRSAILDSSDDTDGREDVGAYLQRKIADLKSFFRRIIRDINDEEMALLDEDLIDTYKLCHLYFDSNKLPDEFPTLSTLDKVMSEKPDRIRLRRILSPYITGAYKTMFNGQTNWSLDNPLTVLDLATISKEIQPQMMDLLIKDVWEDIKRDRNELINFVIDEFQKLADKKSPETLMLGYDMVKLGRKYGLRFVPACQNIADLLEEEKYGTAIINNCMFKTFFRMGEQDLKLLQTFMSFSKRQLKVLSSKKTKGRGLFFAGDQRVELQVRANLDEIKIVDPEQYEKLTLVG